MTTTSTRRDRRTQVWVLGHGVDKGLLERLGDARRAAEQLGCNVGAVVVDTTLSEAEQLVAYGADSVAVVPLPLGTQAAVATTTALLAAHHVRLIFAAGDCRGREWAARLAARCGYMLVSPALLVQVRNHACDVTGLSRDGRLARKIMVPSDATVVLTMRQGVAEQLPADPTRTGEIRAIEAMQQPEGVTQLAVLAADPAHVDIRYAERLVAGGRGVGSREGFARLRRFADKLGAGLAASRMAVDLGWIEPERQVGQTGKTVTPDLYIACGISGASHHLEGMAGAAHIVAINTDADAPIFRVAHLGLVADLHEVLAHTEAGLSEP